eukprot:TRINITY_DN5867_c0_g1_i1.p1 TRINITY_DN5867_c0_g1~~TRINITY_DN5867_c0_g1_i1.p1  ORF type:complete len:756 (+),score=126.51 TRINITY_DN5867_c0_g1_i1:71-2338(+)
MESASCSSQRLQVIFFLAAAAAALGEVRVPLPGGHALLSTRGPSALRLRLVPSGTSRLPISTPMVDPGVIDASFQEVRRSSEGSHGISTAFGDLLVTPQGGIRLERPGGGSIMESLPLNASDQSLVLSQRHSRLLGGGSSGPSAKHLEENAVSPLVCNTAVFTPYYYSEDGYGALAAVEMPDYNRYPASYRLNASKSHVTWTFEGAWEIYFMPAPNLSTGTKAFYALTGSPPVPPRSSFGFIASRWGWQNRSYIEDTISAFREKRFPLDAIIIDFEWYTNETDYGFKRAGKAFYHDFGFNEETFPEPQKQLQQYKDRYHVIVGGIRKPRIGNTEVLKELREKGWIWEHGEPAGAYPPYYEGAYAIGRGLNFSMPEVRDWYAQKLQPLLADGMSFWWNDEGEAGYFMFHNWNEAQLEAHRLHSPQKRFWSLNRAFTPGMSRLGATAWTGDVGASWDSLYETPGTMLKWILAGAPYVACDTGGFAPETSGELLTRWTQVAVYMPTMRVHSVNSVTPHWPWLFGKAAGSAMREALNLRYRLLPYHYSLAHAMHSKREMWIRPLAMDFPEDETARTIHTQWMDGDILASPVLRDDGRYDAYLPSGSWYRLDKVLAGEEVTPVSGPDWKYGRAAFSEAPAFVKAGTILPLGPVVQHSGEIGKGPLEVYVFGGEDAVFELVEDDGESVQYVTGLKRTTVFRWDDGLQRLSWAVSGDAVAPGVHGFSQVSMTYIDEHGKVQKVEPQELPLTGSIRLLSDHLV